jgi:hypothetical protein
VATKLVDIDGLQEALALPSRKATYEFVYRQPEGFPVIRIGQRGIRFDLDDVVAFLKANSPRPGD